MGLFDLLIDPIGVMEQNADARERQDKQWQVANKALLAAGEDLVAENYEAATAAALVGLLALQLSRT